MTFKKIGFVVGVATLIVVAFQNCTQDLPDPGAAPSTKNAGNLGSTYCLPTSLSNCIVNAVQSGGTSGACPSGFTGSCAYTCASGSWSMMTNSCTPGSTGGSGGGPASCAPTTSNHCAVAATASGGQSGSCEAGYTGSCSASCSSGSWSVSVNSCHATCSSAIWAYNINMAQTSNYTCTANGTAYGSEMDCRIYGTCLVYENIINHCKSLCSQNSWLPAN